MNRMKTVSDTFFELASERLSGHPSLQCRWETGPKGKRTLIIPKIDSQGFDIRIECESHGLYPNDRRLNEQLSTVAAFGNNPQGGVSRLAYSEADLRARAYVTGLMRAKGTDRQEGRKAWSNAATSERSG